MEIALWDWGIVIQAVVIYSFATIIYPYLFYMYSKIQPLWPANAPNGGPGKHIIRYLFVWAVLDFVVKCLRMLSIYDCLVIDARVTMECWTKSAWKVHPRILAAQAELELEISPIDHKL